MNKLAPLALAFAAVSALALAAPGCVESGPGDEDDDEDSVGAEWEHAFEQQQDLKDSSCSGVTVPDHSGFNKRIALTFDDGPNLETTPEVLDILKAHGIHAAFMINGKRVTSDAHRALLDRVLREGHILGNHTQDHKNATELSSSELRSQIEKTDAVLRATGITPKYFRFPFGASNCATADTARSYGYTITGWHIDSADWCFASGGGTCPKSTFKYVDDRYRSDLVGLTLSQAKSTGGGIILFHDIHANTANHLDEILTRLESEGFTFTTIDDTTTFPRLNSGNTAALPFIGTACQADETCAYTGGYCLRGDTADGVCSANCNGYCDDLDGHAPTFCAEINPSFGACLPKAHVTNDDCKSLPGTTAKTVDRYIGTSTAPAATATVCVPQ
jgi:peptidoglycan/xylan/chitin deacetylase (PgdA/CDA1 family)